jgi:hypothetical protein
MERVQSLDKGHIRPNPNAVFENLMLRNKVIGMNANTPANLAMVINDRMGANTDIVSSPEHTRSPAIFNRGYHDLSLPGL